MKENFFFAPRKGKVFKVDISYMKKKYLFAMSTLQPWQSLSARERRHFDQLDHSVTWQSTAVQKRNDVDFMLTWAVVDNS